MPVVVQRVDALVAAIDEVMGAAPLQRKPKEMLDEIRRDALAIRERLMDLHENWCSLAIAPRLTLTPARELWTALPSGRRPGTDPEVTNLLRASPTLDAMHKGGVNLLSVYKFDDERCRLAATIGDAFADWQFCWDRFKNALARAEPKFEMQARDFEAAQGFLEAMIRAEVIASFETWMFSHRDKAWGQINRKKIRFLNPGQPIGIKFDLIKGGLSGFVGGDWLTAYAFQIIDDHLSRNAFDYEIYTQVRYEAPPDVLRVSGDFDVLTRAGQKALLIECKSGRIRSESGRDDFAEIAAKARGFRQVLEKVRAEVVDIEFLLVFNPYLSAPEQVISGFEGTGVRPIRPDEIRGTIMEMFR